MDDFESFESFDGDERPVEEHPREDRRRRIVDLWNELRPVLGPELSVLDEEPER
jgi:hypothetical protein